MPEIVEPHLFHAVPLDEGGKLRGQVIGPHPLAQLIYKYKAVIFVVVAIAADLFVQLLRRLDPVSYTHLGYEPKEKPDARFYEAMRQLSTIGNNINQLAVKTNALGFIDTPMLKTEALRWHKFQADIEAVFLRPGESNLKWQ